jgi:UDP-glucose 4-epimerase
VVEGPRRPGDPAMLVAGVDKATRELGWKPRHSDLETIIATAWNGWSGASAHKITSDRATVFTRASAALR